MIKYNRELLIHTLIYHQRKNAASCICGWNLLGASHADHVVDTYERAYLAETVK